MANYALITGPGSEPVSLTEAKAHLRVDVTDDDTLITDLTKRARDYVERYTRLLLIDQVWEMYLDDFPSALPATLTPEHAAKQKTDGTIIIEKAPISAIGSLKYVDSDGVTQTLATTEYRSDLKALHPRITPEYDKSWPTIRRVTNAITIRFNVGYANAAAVPNALKHAILLLVGSWYQNRELSLVGASGEMPKAAGLDALLWSYRVWSA